MAPVEEAGPETGEITPLRTWEELVGWREPSVPVQEVVSVRQLCPRALTLPSPHTLVCHDMKGGYLDDRFYQGCKNKDAYRFYHWSGIDTFVYFSHAFITLPPVGWINAAHTHGVQVLGTIITEWEEGAALCEKMLRDESSVQKAVSQLVNIAHYYGFEGWLINIENAIKIEHIGRLVEFVTMLSEGMRKSCAESCVLWYDSVTSEGKLDWQNELNGSNRKFFEACDGIFLNYTWTGEHLARSRQAAGLRAHQVYVGLDVHGRNFYGGGKLNTHTALEVVRHHGLSAAIFAPGWTYETHEDFVECERLLWRSLAPYLTHRGPACLPYTTSFCQGFGEQYFVHGRVDSREPWHDLSKQQPQPLWSQEGDNARLSLVTSDAYMGGGCLGITFTAPTTVRLLLCRLGWSSALTVSVSYKWQGAPVPLSFVLQLVPESGEGSHRTVYLRCAVSLGTAGEEGGSSSQEKLQQLTEEKKRDMGDMMWEDCGRTEGGRAQLVDSTHHNGWTLKSFLVEAEAGLRLGQVEVEVGAACKLLLGQLVLQDNSSSCPLTQAGAP